LAILKTLYKFLDDRYGYPITIGNIINRIKEEPEEFDLYRVLDSFDSYLLALPKKLANTIIINYVGAVRTYLQHYNIDIIQYKFDRRIHMPKEYHEEDQQIYQHEIMEMLKSCYNRRLIPYLCVLASGGMRPNKALALRLNDVDFSESPTEE
jgi:integrase